MRITEIYLIAPEKLTFECILDYFESRVIFFTVVCFIWKERVKEVVRNFIIDIFPSSTIKGLFVSIITIKQPNYMQFMGS